MTNLWFNNLAEKKTKEDVERQEQQRIREEQLALEYKHRQDRLIQYAKDHFDGLEGIKYKINHCYCSVFSDETLILEIQFATESTPIYERGYHVADENDSFEVQRLTVFADKQTKQSHKGFRMPLCDSTLFEYLEPWVKKTNDK